MDAPAAADISLFEGFRLDRRAGVLFRRDQKGVFMPIAIGRRALDLLGVLVERPGDLISRDEIIEAVWPETTVEDSNLNVQIAALRRLLDDGRAEGSCIQTVSGRGYRFVEPVTRVEPAALPISSRNSGNGGGGPIAGHGGPHGSSTGVLAHVAAAPRLSIVVLPFTNLSDDREQQYFADGITEDLTTDLSRIDGSFVISCNTAFTYKHKPVDTKQIGRELCVRYLLEGSVRRSGNQFRVNAQLIDAESDGHVWAELFERDTADLFALQDEITRQIAISLHLELVGAEAARPTEHPEALDYILRGRAAHRRPPSRENRRETVGLLERALALNPHSVAAQSYLVNALTGLILDNMTDTPAADLRRAEGLADQALAASLRSPLAHYAKGQVLRTQRRYLEAIAEYEEVIALDRNWMTAYAHIGSCKFYNGSIEEAIPLIEQAIRLSPRDPVIGVWYMWIGQVHLVQSRTGDAVAWLEKARSTMPANQGPHALLAAAYALEGGLGRAAAELAEARRLSRDDRFSSIARLKAVADFGVPKIGGLFEATYFVGLRKAGTPEE
jgi:adenylate cyclase